MKDPPRPLVALGLRLLNQCAPVAAELESGAVAWLGRLPEHLDLVAISLDFIDQPVRRMREAGSAHRRDNHIGARERVIGVLAAPAADDISDRDILGRGRLRYQRGKSHTKQ